MKVYLIEMDNCKPYEDNHTWITTAFSTFRGASQWLIDQDFKPYCETLWGDKHIAFLWEESDEYMEKCLAARIIEMDVIE